MERTTGADRRIRAHVSEEDQDGEEAGHSNGAIEENEGENNGHDPGFSQNEDDD